MHSTQWHTFRAPTVTNINTCSQPVGLVHAFHIQFINSRRVYPGRGYKYKCSLPLTCYRASSSVRASKCQFGRQKWLSQAGGYAQIFKSSSKKDQYFLRKKNKIIDMVRSFHNPHAPLPIFLLPLPTKNLTKTIHRHSFHFRKRHRITFQYCLILGAINIETRDKLQKTHRAYSY